ncbi:hypothetical protein CVT26_004249 [Gymnopilus dilepis]|uniref:Uncharacterized protein n=1 Tax=Gymnopilus dilepis TaxID=231916 RepID=A0A409W753_9AGAR|nr:hypothetical protein CVT26_004249 [Gymnopilus dilepis]
MTFPSQVLRSAKKREGDGSSGAGDRDSPQTASADPRIQSKPLELLNPPLFLKLNLKLERAYRRRHSHGTTCSAVVSSASNLILEILPPKSPFPMQAKLSCYTEESADNTAPLPATTLAFVGVVLHTSCLKNNTTPSQVQYVLNSFLQWTDYCSSTVGSSSNSMFINKSHLRGFPDSRRSINHVPASTGEKSRSRSNEAITRRRCFPFNASVGSQPATLNVVSSHRCSTLRPSTSASGSHLGGKPLVYSNPTHNYILQ